VRYIALFLSGIRFESFILTVASNGFSQSFHGCLVPSPIYNSPYVIISLDVKPQRVIKRCDFSLMLENNSAVPVCFR
jgi:hypothetical protein